MKGKNKNGFLLLEAVLAISILAIICAANMQRTRFIREQRCNEIVQQNYATITYALASFVNRNYRLPKPAKTMVDGEEDSNAKSGYVPYSVLGLIKNNVVDGRGNPMIYTPNPELTNTAQSIHTDINDDKNFCKNIPSPQIVLHGQKHCDTTIAFVISDTNPIYSSNTMEFNTTNNIYWITRDILLMQYLKTAPCQCHKAPSIQQASNTSDFF